ncbi:uncharacterized protein LOC129216702 [Uloborus diversus]|uniref:uncharacterized protein LOC129216702 n=1 Tax=Uloborus diversus TaxID=327109 RepID=UPI00240979EC|nr:uncharacterized protein LOC129216702 [Uloborus diversus]
MKCGILCSVSCLVHSTPAVSCEVMEPSGDSELEPLPEIGELILKTNADVEPFVETTSSDLPSISELIEEFKCKPCVVVLHRLNPDEIELHTKRVLSSHADGLELDLLSTSCRLEKKTIQKQKLFEKYKLSRQNFRKRKRSQAHKHGSDEFFSEAEFEEQNSRHLKKRKGRNRKRLTYEDDVEWSPDSSKHMYAPSYKTKVNKATKMLRQNARRKIIDSASSDSEDGYYWEKFGHNQEESKMNKTVSNFPVERANPVSDKLGGTESNPGKYDVLSQIMQDMDNQHNGMAKRKFNEHKKINSFTKCNLSPEKRQKRKRKISVMGGKFVRSNSNSNTVSSIVEDIVSLVCSAADTSGKKTVSNITMKICRSCGTPFSNSQANEQLCIICKDFTKRNSFSKRVKGVKTNHQKLNKGFPKSPKSKSKVKNRLLKVVPKCDMQRLLYGDKTDKLSLEKGYNHCKTITLSTQNNEKILDISIKSSDQSQSSDTVLKRGKGPGSKKNAAKGKKLQMNQKNNQVTNKKTKCTLKEVKANPGKFSSVVNSDSKSEANLSQNHVSLTNVGKGLFLMTFPEPDKELKMEGNLSKLSSKKENKVLSKMTVTESKSSNASAVDIAGKNTSGSGKNDNLEIPPLPTVVVANYAGDDAGEFSLSSIFYQNDSTAPTRPQLIPKPVQSQLIPKPVQPQLIPKPVQLNVVVNRPQLSITPVLTRNSSPLTTSILPNLLTTSSYMPTSVRPTSVLIHQPATNITLSAPSGPLIINQGNTLCRVTNTNTCLSNMLTSNIRMQNNLPGQITLVSNPYPDFSTAVSGSLSSNNESQLKITSVGTVRTSYEIQNNRLNPSEMYLSAETGEFLPKNNTALSGTSHLCNEITAQNKSNTTLENASPKGETDLKLNQKESNTSVKRQTGTANASETSESTPKYSPFSAVYEEIEAIGVLAVLDLESNPRHFLNMRLELAKIALQNARSSSSDKISNCEFQCRILEIAQKWLRQYGSFQRVSDHLLGKDNLIKIKKEILEEEEEEEQEDGRSSCAFSKSPASFSSSTDNSLHTVPQNSYSNPSPAAGPLERLETQIASINHPVLPDFEPSSIMHHYPSASLGGAAAASAPMTPRNDFDSRMTPSRGSSGPRTPARPESATLQVEELTAAQIKQEKFENAISPSSRCAFSQSTTPISSQTITTQIANPLNAIASVANMPIISSSIVAQQLNQQSMHQYRAREIPPNRTAPFDTSQNLARALLTMNPRPPSGNVLNVQQVYLPGNAGYLRAPAPVPSTLSSNNFVLRQNASVNVTSGQIVVNNNAQMSSQALYPVLSSAANQQVYNTNQQTYNSNQQVYYTPQVSTSLVPSPSSYVVQNKPLSVDVDQMFCAVCNKVATLRCKQCAKVAYCNTACAKIYWHKKHKMECRSTASEL